MVQVIINADDFGINPIVTSEIERMIELGIVTSTTIMANGSCLDEVKRFALLHPKASFGIHLCLSEFDSITKSETLQRYGIIDSNGQFIKFAIFNVKRFPDDLKKAIKQELIAQVDIIKSLNIPISHIDSHHHVHTIYQLHDVFEEVMACYGFNKIRLGTKVEPIRMVRQRFFNRSESSVPAGEKTDGPIKTHRNIVKRIGSLLSATVYRYLLNRRLHSLYKTTDAFFSYSSFLQRLHEREVIKYKAVELMCHPGHPGRNYQDEMHMVEAKIIETGSIIELISYNEL